MTPKVSRQFSFFKLFFYLVLIEIVIGGSGRMIEFGPLSFKMVLFGISLVLTFFNLRKLKFDKYLLFFEFFFIFSILFSFSVGALNFSSTENIFEDLKPLLFILMINFFLIAIDGIKTINNVIRIIKYFSLFMAIIYIIFVILLFMNIINFSTFYEQQSEIGEILFRNQYMVFYKGFLYLGVGFLFLAVSQKRTDKIYSIIVFVALCLTLTRGFILMAAAVYGFYIFFVNKKASVKILVSAITIGLLIYLLPIMFNVLGDKSESDIVRIITFHQVTDEINLLSFFIGHGFGHGVEARPIHMEISYLEIFHKQGILGLFFWFYVLYIVFKYYFSIKNQQFKRMALPFLLSVCFTFLQSLTNPYINNPIGISICMLSIAVLYRLNVIECEMQTQYFL